MPLRLLLLLLLHYTCSESIPSGSGESTDEEGLVGDYLYKDGDADSVFPVVEVVAPEENESLHEAGSGHQRNKTNFTRPEFLYSSNYDHRIVEFYAPWCPHCRDFRDHYISFTRKVKEMADQHGEKVEVYAISCTAHRYLCQEQNITSYPKIKVYKSGSATPTTFEAWDFHPFEALATLGVTADDIELVEPEVKHYSQNKDTQVKTKKIPRSKAQLYRDIASSFDFAMRNSIFMSKGPLSNHTSYAFAEWIELLHQTMPPMLKIHGALSSFREHMGHIIADENNLIEILDQHPSDKTGWSSSCRHGSSDGYTCGLWEMFHVMTIGLVEWNSFTGDAWNVVAPADAAARLKNYIESFFGCEVCRLNFIAMYDSCEHNRCNRLASGEETDRNDWIQLPLWLWETHNSVNVRLMKERAAKEGRIPMAQDEIDSQWPSRQECPHCWRDDGTWDEDVVFKFLRLEYWPNDATSEEYRQTLYVDQETDTFDEEIASTSFLPFVPVIFLFFGASWSYAKKVERDMTGRHKKDDSMV